MHRDGELELPLPGGGDTTGRWRELARWGRRDLTLARLAEGHTDAVAILREAGREPAPGALYGVWASRSGGGPELLTGRGEAGLSGRVRFCSGARSLDRALVTTRPTDDAGPLLLDVGLRDARVRPDPESWPAIGMDASDSLDVAFDALPVPRAAIVGAPGFYLDRPGFALGGAGVAAVWLGGTAAVVDDVLAALSGREPDPHKLAHLGAMHTGLAAAEALLCRAACRIDAAPRAEHGRLVDTCRAATEAAASETLRRAPTVFGPGPLCWDRPVAQRLADLQVYVRQHHGERDLAALGQRLLDERSGQRS